MHYYNENDPKLAEWLRNLIKAGLLPEGYVDDRSITEVKGTDLAGYTQCHFFAGIGGWPLALELAGWPTTRPVWTGSCPCQPFSNAGRQGGTDDPRHLWPQFQRLIHECNPPVVFGEQVASKAGRAWLSGVRTDLKELGYGVGGADLCGASIGSPHIRQRLYWVATSGVDNATSNGAQREGAPIEGSNGANDRLLGETGSHHEWVGNTIEQGLEGLRWASTSGHESRWVKEEPHRPAATPSTDGTPWDGAVYIDCLDGKSRRVEPRIRPLADGVSGRVVKLRAYGNAIIPQVGAEFVTAFMEIEEGRLA